MERGNSTREKHERLEELSRVLAPRGYEVELGATNSGVPLLRVADPARPGLLSETIACVAGSEGTLDAALHFRWPWGSHLAEVTDLNGAVAEVARVLGGGDG